mmetsp:Transcript_37221/g.50366  ORF Transcript_37221/g.50366 Transcript_37221/m.50366 type:complete len:201 (+) Transcript_37221:882-1484(+)
MVRFSSVIIDWLSSSFSRNRAWLWLSDSLAVQLLCEIARCIFTRFSHLLTLCCSSTSASCSLTGSSPSSISLEVVWSSSSSSEDRSRTILGPKCRSLIDSANASSSFRSSSLSLSLPPPSSLANSSSSSLFQSPNLFISFRALLSTERSWSVLKLPLAPKVLFSPPRRPLNPSFACRIISRSSSLSVFISLLFLASSKAA